MFANNQLLLDFDFHLIIYLYFLHFKWKSLEAFRNINMYMYNVCCLDSAYLFTFYYFIYFIWHVLKLWWRLLIWWDFQVEGWDLAGRCGVHCVCEFEERPATAIKWTFESVDKQHAVIFMADQSPGVWSCFNLPRGN